MGKRGPARTPTAILEQRGSWLAKRRKPIEDAMSKGADFPIPPAWLTNETALSIYTEIGASAAAVMTPGDAPALALLAMALADLREALDYMEKHGMYSKNSRGRLAISPAWRMAKDAWERSLKMLREFGLTPASRSTVSLARQDTIEDFYAHNSLVKL